MQRTQVLWTLFPGRVCSSRHDDRQSACGAARLTGIVRISVEISYSLADGQAVNSERIL